MDFFLSSATITHSKICIRALGHSTYISNFSENSKTYDHPVLNVLSDMMCKNTSEGMLTL
jgi:hypothetical protein